MSVQKHYHVIGGLHGCMSNFNELYDDLETSKDRLVDITNDFKESENKVESDHDGMYIEISEKIDSLCDYVEISECTESECYNENGELNDGY